ncbi:sugar ABC transporter permease [Clostridia bacterium]|nr:sugar ABC transporter permease [Clostridia bacterium]
MIYAFVALFTLFCFLPFWVVVINSFAAEEVLRVEGYRLIPSKFSLFSYRYLFDGRQIYSSYLVTVSVTLAGTVLSLLISSMFAYTLAHPRVKYRGILSFLTYFTTIFGANMVGSYILIANWLHMKDTIFALILPMLLNPFNAFILVAFFRTLPIELSEAATVDGANDAYIFFRLVWPISTPALATVALLYALQYWNDFWLALMYIDNYKLHPLQIMIRQMISSLRASAYIGNTRTNYQQITPYFGLQLSTVCLTIGPIILLYPLLQRYFVTGLTIGAIKG